MKKISVVICLGILFLAGVAAGQGWEFDRILFEHEGGGGLHGVVVAPDGNIWICTYKDYLDTIIVDRDIPWLGDTLAPDTGLAYGLYILDSTGAQVDFSPLRILELPDGTLDTIWAGSDWNGTGKGISLDKDGNILYSSWSTLYRIDYKTGKCLNRFITGDVGLPMSSLTEAVQDDEGLIYCSYVLGSGKPIFILDDDFNYIGNAADDFGHINRSFVVTPDGKDLYAGSTWMGMGVEHWHSDIPGVLAYTPVDTFNYPDSIYVESLWVAGDTWRDTTYWAYNPNMWAECLDWGPDGLLWVGETWIGWTQDYEGTPTGSRWIMLDVATGEIVGSLGIPMGDPAAGGMWTPRGAAWSADGKTMYLCDFDYDIVSVWKKVVGVKEDRHDVPLTFKLWQNYPNPFNYATTISFTLSKNGFVELKVYDIVGREVKTLISKPMTTGNYNVTFDATGLASGVYYCRMAFDGHVLTKKMLLLK
ncbi:MAG TPA: T9SS type A sorting domain-containing protein [bacterium (Candidatus Stahlbacteria)]|nr:T9SS type A sorting domain-containing protein [Candidatus Stahlbacteria bacterium]